MTEWYLEAGTPDTGAVWWAVEHRGHPALYLRALMPGDFAPGRLPLPRHVIELDGTEAPPEVRCGVCDEVPRAEDLGVIERSTGDRGFLAELRAGRRPWPRPTDPASCWLCSSRTARADREAQVGGATVRVCERCSGHLARGR